MKTCSTIGLLLAFAAGLHAATTIFAATEVGPVKSTDGGATWQLLPVNVNGGLLSGQPSLYAVAVDPKTPTTWYATGYASGTYGFYKTTDSGQTWSGTAFGSVRATLGQGSIVIDPVLTNIIYALGTDGTHTFIIKSTDSGATWTKLKLPNSTLYTATSYPDGTPPNQITTDPRVSGLLYAVSSAEGYVFKSVDFGVTWSVLTSGVDIPDGSAATGGFPYLDRLEVDPKNSQVLYASAITGASNSISTRCKITSGGGECGLYKSVDGGLTWAQTGLPSPSTFSLSVDPVSGAIYTGVTLTSTGNTVSKSTDGGLTWTPLTNKIGGVGGPFVRVDPNNPTTIYAFAHLGSGNAQDTYLRSTDSGATWTALSTPHLCPLSTPKCLNPLHNTLSDLVIVPAPAASAGPPAISANGVVNGASFQPGLVANSWATIVGTNLAPSTDTWEKAITGGKLPTTLDGVSVSIGGKPAYLEYVSPGQINVIAPDVGPGPVQVTVTTAAGSSSSFSVSSSLYGPAFFGWPNSQVVATRQDFSFAAKAGTFAGLTTVPAKPGEVLILWGTGFGPTSPASPTGMQVPADQTYSTSPPPSITIDNVPATVYGAALAPGFAGLYQVAIQVPASLGDGDWPIQATMGGAQSPTGWVLSVHR